MIIKTIKQVRAIGLTVLSFAAVGALVAPSADAAEPSKKGTWYVVGAGGLAMPNDYGGTSGGTSYTGEYENGPFASGALGYYVTRSLRLEAELSYLSLGYKNVTMNGTTTSQTGDTTLLGGTAGVYWDLQRHRSWGIYVGAGGGEMSWDQGTINGTTTVPGKDGTDLTAFGEAGFSYDVTDSVSLVPAYRFQWLDTGTATRDDDSAHIVKLGLRYDLN